VFAATVVTAAIQIRRYRAVPESFPDAEKVTRIDPRFVYDVMPGPKMRTFDLASEITLKRPDGAARIVFDFTDVSNHHYVEFTPQAIQIVVMQDGIGRVLETAEKLSLPVAKPMHVTVKRRELAIRVLVDDVLAAEASDETFHGGKVGYASVEGSAEVTKPRVQAVGDIYFADDFMRSEKEKGPWTELRGNWHINALEYASMSANAFQYYVSVDKEESGEKTPAEKKEGTAVTGYPFWDDYSFEAAVKPQKRAPVGLYFYYRDENNYFRFDWYPQDENVTGSGKKELVRMWHGEKTVLARQGGGFRLNQWYTMKCEVSGDRARTYIDENLVFDRHDARLVSGMVGLYAGANSRTYFDDVFVRSYKYFEDPFTNGSRTAWSFMGGEWSRLSVGAGVPADNDTGPPGARPAGVLTVRSPKGEARAAVGDGSWKNYVLETEIYPESSGLSAAASAKAGRTGVILYYQDETRYYQVSSRRAERGPGETWTLERVLDDRRTVLDNVSTEASSGRKLLCAGIRDGYIWVTVNGRKVLEGFDTSLASGRPGLFASDVACASFGPVKVDWPLEPTPLLTLNEIFEHEQSMLDWSNIESDWRRTESGLWLHKGNFPGDASIETDVRGIEPGGGELGLVLSADGDTTYSGYLLKLASGTKTTDVAAKTASTKLDSDLAQRTLELFRKGKSLGSVVLDAELAVSRVSLRRTGSYLLGFVNRKCVLARRDAAPLKGDILGWYSRDIRVDTKSVAVSSPNVHEYLFRRAHTDWRVVAGIWEVTNRWQCDPRWTFFSGRSSWKLAAIWNKRKLSGNVTLDFYVGPKMDRERGQNYEYVSDMNCTLAADGSDLSSGYSFLFGGFGNTKTVLLRENKVVVEGKWKNSQGYMQEGQPAIIPSSRGMSIHRMWFHVKAQKKGGRLRLWIDDQLVIDYTDDKPLTGDHVALWTWNNGIMMARVVVSAEKTGAYESPDLYRPAHCRCIYDEQTVAGTPDLRQAVAEKSGVVDR